MIRSLLVYLGTILTPFTDDFASFNATGTVSSVTIPSSPTVEMWGLGIIVSHESFVGCIEKTRVPFVFIGVI